MVPIRFVGSSENAVSREELIDEALRRLHGVHSTEIPKKPEMQEDRRWTEETCDEYKTRCERPSIRKSRQALRKMAQKAAELAALFRQEKGALILGTATEGPDDSPEQIVEKRQEIESAQNDLLAAANDLDQISDRLNERAARWDGKDTGQLPSAEAMAFGNPQNWLAEEAAQKFNERRPDDLNKSEDGDFYIFVGLLHEIAMGAKSEKPYALLKACRAAVEKVRSAA